MDADATRADVALMTSQVTSLDLMAARVVRVARGSLTQNNQAARDGACST